MIVYTQIVWTPEPPGNTPGVLQDPSNPFIAKALELGTIDGTMSFELADTHVSLRRGWPSTEAAQAWIDFCQTEGGSAFTSGTIES